MSATAGLSPQTLRKSSMHPELHLYQAIANSDISSCLSLLEREEVNVNWKNCDKNEESLLGLATKLKNCTLIALLIGRGADVCSKDASGKSVLEYALDTQDPEVIRLVSGKTMSALEESKRKLEKILRKEKEEVHRDRVQFSKETVDILKQADADTLDTRPRSGSLNPFQTHVPRASLIVEMLKVSHFQTIYNIFVAVFMISFLNILLSNWYEKGSMLDFDLLFWCFSDLQMGIFLWCCLFVGSFSAYLLQKGIVAKKISPLVAYSIYGTYSIGMYLLMPFIVRGRGMPPATSAIVMCELVRLSMKMHSYLMVNRSLRRAQEKNESFPCLKEYPGNVTAENYFEFLWFPTLVYQTSYPRTERINLEFVVRRFIDVMLCTLYTYAIFVRYCVPIFPEVTGDYQDLIMATFKVMLPGIVLSLLAFYGVLHSWLNAFAEITRFADRQFYMDWWTSTSWDTYYRKWNNVVHRFLHNHIFKDCITESKLSKHSAMWITFLISAVVHEYVIAVTLGYYKPVLFILFVVPGVFFIYLTKSMKASSGWNIFMWAMLIIGHGMLISLYARGYYYVNNATYSFQLIDLIAIV